MIDVGSIVDSTDSCLMMIESVQRGEVSLSNEKEEWLHTRYMEVEKWMNYRDYKNRKRRDDLKKRKIDKRVERSRL